MKQFLITLAGVFSGLLLFFVGLPILFICLIAAGSKPAATPAHTVLTLDLRQALSDQEPNSPLSFLNGRNLSVITVVETLSRAARDPNIQGMLIRLPEGGMPPAQADELRLAIKHFRSAGKLVIAHSQGLYPSGVSTATYMLGASADQLWMQPGAAMQSSGIASEDLFLKRFFDKYGVVADFQQRKEYKNAINPMLYDDYTPAHREAELGWMNSVYDTELTVAAQDRNQDPKAFKAVIADAPYGADEALAHRLIDRVGGVEDAVGVLKSRAGADAQLMDLAKYRNTPRSTSTVTASSGSAIALIGAEGDIVTGTANSQSLTDTRSDVYSDDVAKAFQDAIADDQVKAIVFRVSSPGGSDTASEQILSAVMAAKAAHKPVVVSMGTYAASGGYWISSNASEIVAEPTTLTGSIGVFGGKLVYGPALSRFGLDLRDLSVGGDFAGAYGSAQPFTTKQKAAISAWMDRIYDGFVQRVATGRKLPVARVQEIAKGRVWTGIQAQQLGLVDKLGGLSLAVGEAKRLAGLPADQGVVLKVLPAKKTPLDTLQRAMGLSAASTRAASTALWLLDDPHARMALDDLARVRLQSEGQGAVLAPTPFQ
ncbi:MAG: signal peptide peptidase SppA [Caulobacteraceae bacterium]